MIAIKRYITILDLCNFLKTNFDLDNDGNYWKIFGVIQVGTFENKDAMFYEFNNETMKAFISSLHGYETDPIENALLDITGSDKDDAVFVAINNGKLETDDDSMGPDIPKKEPDEFDIPDTEVLIPRGTVQPNNITIPSFLQNTPNGPSFKERIDAKIVEQKEIMEEKKAERAEKKELDFVDIDQGIDDIPEPKRPRSVDDFLSGVLK